MKRIIGTFFTLLLTVQPLCSAVFATDEVATEVSSTELQTVSDVVFTLTDTKAEPGSVAEVELYVSSTVAFNSMAIYGLTYDTDVLSFRGFAEYDAIEEKCLFKGGFDDETGAIVLALSTGEALESYVCKILFDVADTAATGTYTVSASSLIKDFSTELTSEVISSTVTVACAHEHTLTYCEAAEATCVSEARIAHWYCPTCDLFFSDSDGCYALSRDEIFSPLNPENHGETELRDYVAPTVQADGFSGNTYCLDCGEKTEEGVILPAIDPVALFTLKNATAAPGETVAVEVYVTSTEPYNSVALYDLTYDSTVLTFAGFSDYDAIEGKCEFTGCFDNDLGVVTLPLKENEALDGYLYKILFTLSNTAADGQYAVGLTSLVKADDTELVSFAEPAVVSVTTPTPAITGTWGESGTWELKKGVLTISGSCTMADGGWQSSSTPWGSHRIEVTKIVIAKDVTNIGAYAFYAMSNLKEIEFEAGSALTTIGTVAFGYTGLASIVIPASVSTIQAYAFQFCASLTSVDFEANSVLTEIGAYAFRDCTALTSITLPERVISLGLQVFVNSKAMTANVASGSRAYTYVKSSNIAYTEYIGTYCGYCGENTTWVLATDGTLYIDGTGAMSDYTYASTSAPWGKMRAQVKEVVIGAGVTYIGNFSFYNMPNLTSVTFAGTSSLEGIGNAAFGYATSLKTIELPASLKTIGNQTFYFSGLETVTFEANSKLDSTGIMLFQGCASLQSVYIPAKVASIGDIILYNAPNAKLLVASNSFGMTYATANNYPMEVRDETLTGTCSPTTTWTLTSDGTLTISGSGSLDPFSPSYKSVPWGTSRNYVKKVVIGKDITVLTNFAFFNMPNLEEVVFEEGTVLNYIGTGSIGYTGVKALEIPATVSTIRECAIYFNDYLETVTFEEGSVLATIGEYAFRDCPALTDLYLPTSVATIGTNILYLTGAKSTATVNVALGTPAYRYAVWNDYTMAVRDTAVSGTCGENATWAFDNETGVLTIGGSGEMSDFFYGLASTKSAPWARNALNLREFITKIVIGKDITKIGAFAFYGLTNATELEFEAGSALTTIGNGAFGYCGFTKAEIPASVVTIQDNAFYFSAALATVTFEEGSALTSIGSYAFRNCTALTTCAYPEGTALGTQVFYQCPELVK